MKKKTKKSFTLAEVLIAIAIIGVIAAITIPSLVREYQKMEYVTRLKKAYSLLNQQIQKMAADKDCKKDLECLGLFATGKTTQNLGDELVKYFKIYKNCGITPNQGCWATDTNENFDGSSTTTNNYDSGSDYKFITMDGMSFRVTNFAETATEDCENDYSTGQLDYMTQVCGELWIDLNGPHKPNFKGKDIFGFWITNGKGALLYPQGGMDDAHIGWWSTGNHCSPGERSGATCAGRIMENSWDIDYY